jgi:hypothetical protein
VPLACGGDLGSTKVSVQQHEHGDRRTGRHFRAARF